MMKSIFFFFFSYNCDEILLQCRKLVDGNKQTSMLCSSQWLFSTKKSVLCMLFCCWLFKYDLSFYFFLCMLFIKVWHAVVAFHFFFLVSNSFLIWNFEICVFCLFFSVLGNWKMSVVSCWIFGGCVVTFVFFLIFLSQYFVSFFAERNEKMLIYL